MNAASPAWRRTAACSALPPVEDVQTWRREVQAALRQFTQKAAHHGGVFRGALANAEHGFASIAANPKGCDHLPVFERRAVDQHRAQPQLAQRTLHQLLHLLAGYSDYDGWLNLTREGVNFVTRLKDSALYGVVESRPAPENSNVMRDEVMVLVSQQEVGPQAGLRRIEVWVEEKNETMVFVTNNLQLAARTIARIYKERWHIELFFESWTWCTPMMLCNFKDQLR